MQTNNKIRRRRLARSAHFAIDTEKIATRTTTAAQSGAQHGTVYRTTKHTCFVIMRWRSIIFSDTTSKRTPRFV
jgi:hypothetical protein